VMDRMGTSSWDYGVMAHRIALVRRNYLEVYYDSRVRVKMDARPDWGVSVQ
jgi:hypothetical protein